jgi:hypothetical protein
MDSQELTGWEALLYVQRVEQEQAAEEARMRADSDDGEVITFGKARTPFDDDEDT